MERVLFYSENGDVCHHDNYSASQAKEWLKRHGYKVAYTGRKLTRDGIKVIVGINDKNTVPLDQRRKNGLWNARRIVIQ